MMRTLREHGDQEALRWEDWPQVSWEVDGSTVSASVWRFAGGWAAFTDAVSEVVLLAVGVGVDPAGLRLATVVDGAAYGVDLSVPYRYSVYFKDR